MRPARTVLLVAALAVGAVSVAGCAGDDGSAADSLEGTSWALISGVEPRSEAAQTLDFDAERAGGVAGCNGFGFSYAIDGDSIDDGEDFAATTMGCADPAARAEEAYLTLLAEVDGWAIDDGHLVLSTRGADVLRYAPAADP